MSPFHLVAKDIQCSFQGVLERFPHSDQGLSAAFQWVFERLSCLFGGSDQGVSRQAFGAPFRESLRVVFGDLRGRIRESVRAFQGILTAAKIPCDRVLERTYTVVTP